MIVFDRAREFVKSCDLLLAYTAVVATVSLIVAAWK